MRAMHFMPLLFVAACGDGGGGEAQKNDAQAAAATIAAGMWELTSEVTAVDPLDQGRPRIDTPVGTRATASVCVGSGRPPTELFSGDGYRCSFDNYYVHNGRMNVTVRCRRDGLPGSISMLADGRFDAETIEYQRELSTALSGEGDVRIVSRVTGRRTGECAAGGENGNQSANQAG